MTLTKKIILFLTTCMVALPFGGAVFSFIAPWEYDVSAATFLDWHKHIDSYMASRGAFIGLPPPPSCSSKPSSSGAMEKRQKPVSY
jgi:hypothetical protein